MKQPDNHWQQNAWRICAIFLPDLAKVSPVTTVTSTLHLLEPLAAEIFAITGNFPEDAINSDKINIVNIGIKQKYNNTQFPMFLSIPRFIMIQIKISYNLIKIANKIDIVFLAAGAQLLFFTGIIGEIIAKEDNFNASWHWCLIPERLSDMV